MKVALNILIKQVHKVQLNEKSKLQNISTCAIYILLLKIMFTSVFVHVCRFVYA